MGIAKVVAVLATTFIAVAALQIGMGPAMQGLGEGLFGDDMQDDSHDLESDSGETLVDLDEQYKSWKTTVVVGMPTIMMFGAVVYSFVWVFRRQKSTGRL